MPDMPLVLTEDGFVWYRGAKLPFKYVGGSGFEFFEKDPHRAAALGGQRFIVPFDAFMQFVASIELVNKGQREP